MNEYGGKNIPRKMFSFCIFSRFCNKIYQLAKLNGILWSAGFFVFVLGKRKSEVKRQQFIEDA